MSFTPDDQANDGGPGEGANVHSDVEHLTDYITQGIQSGADAYWGSDLSYYSEGTLLVRGTAGANTLTGGLNNDDLDGLAGNDIVSGGIGDDRVNAIDGFADAVFCGPGNDTVAADTLDESPRRARPSSAATPATPTTRPRTRPRPSRSTRRRAR